MGGGECCPHCVVPCVAQFTEVGGVSLAQVSPSLPATKPPDHAMDTTSACGKEAFRDGRDGDVMHIVIPWPMEPCTGPSQQ